MMRLLLMIFCLVHLIDASKTDERSQEIIKQLNHPSTERYGNKILDARRKGIQTLRKKRLASGFQCTSCFCIPSDGPRGRCPLMGLRQSYPAEDYSNEHPFARVFKTYNMNLPSDSVASIVDSNGDPICTPYAELSQTLNLPACTVPKPGRPGSVCGFYYSKACGSGRSDYGMKTYSSSDEAEGQGAVVTHTKACGVCSNANDLAVNMRPDLEEQTERCDDFFTNPTKAHNCFKNIGFTDACAWVFATDMMYVFRRCAFPCYRSRNSPANNPTTCVLNSCHQCYEDVSGEIFQRFAGRTRLNSGIVMSDLKRKCTQIPNVGQNPCA